MLMSFYETTLVPILGISIAVGMVIFLARCYLQWAGKYLRREEGINLFPTTKEGEKR